MKLNLLIRDLRRRKVFRGAGFYLLGAWAVLQVADVIAEPAGLPLWSLTALLYLCVIGFPVAMFLSWRYEWSDEGLVRTRPVTADETGDPALKPLDYFTLAAMVAVIGVVSWQFIPGLREQAIEEQAQVEAALEALENSIAVLPFDFLSDDPGQAYIADGLSDTVMHMLSKVKGLTVTARTSAFYFKGKDMPAGVMARELNVAHLLEGSVQQAGSRLRIIARLIEATSGTELWSANYDREMSDLFEVQDEIATAVMTAMQSQIMADDRERLAREYHPDLAAYEQVVRGRTELAKGTVQSMQNAETHFQRAIELDPDYAWAYVNLVQTWYALGPATGLSRPDNLKRIRNVVDKALELDPTSGEAWDERGKLLVTDKAFAEAEKVNLRAIELAPSYASARIGRGHVLMFKGDNTGYLEQVRIAADLDPTSTDVQQSFATALWANARAEEAISVLKRNLRRHPEVPSNYSSIADYLLQMGRAGEAMRYSLAHRRLDPANMSAWFNYCIQLGSVWDEEGGIACLQEFITANPDHIDARKWLAGGTKNYEEALRLSEDHVKAEPNSWYRKLQYAYYASLLQRWTLVEKIIESGFPQLTTEQPQVNDFMIWPARLLAQALLESEKTEEAQRLLKAAMATIETMRLKQSAGFTTGVEDAQVLVLMGRYEEGLNRLEDAIDSGWQYMSGLAFRDTNFYAVRDTPRCKALQKRMDDIMAEERDYFETHKDEPLI